VSLSSNPSIGRKERKEGRKGRKEGRKEERKKERKKENWPGVFSASVEISHGFPILLLH
jgi:hypothetical protein